MARASSAAAMVMTKMMSTCPNARWPSVKSPNAAKPIRFTLTALSISSMDMRMSTALRRARTPYMPMAKSAAAMT